MWQLVISLLLFFPSFWTAPESFDAKADQRLLVQIEQGAKLETISATLSNYDDIEILEYVLLSFRLNIYAIDLKIKKSTELLSLLQLMPEIKAVQWDSPVSFRKEPDDVNYSRQWGLEIMDAPSAWEITTGGTTANGDEIVVAVLDDGFDIQHEDIIENLWMNTEEIPGDNIDNDNNGYVDDVYGWDYDKGTGDLSISAHGHSVAGIIGAAGNNGIGISGVNWNIKLMLFKTITVSAIVSAYDYIIEQRNLYNETNGREGAFVVATNASFGQSLTFCEDQPIWGSMYDELGKVGVLTGAATVNNNVDVEMVGDMPTTCTSDFLITTLNLNESDRKQSNSGYGLVSIDLGSPGDNSYTIKPFNRYGSFNGNSAAAPHLTGAIALLYAIPCPELASGALSFPEETALTVKEAILNGTVPVADLQGRTATGGRLNVFNSLSLLGERCVNSQGQLAITKVFPNPVRNTLEIEYETPDAELYTVRIFNALGQLMDQSTLEPLPFGQKIFRKNLTDWAPGVYYLTINKGKEVTSTKFVVQ